MPIFLASYFYKNLDDSYLKIDSVEFLNQYIQYNSVAFLFHNH